MEQEELTIPRFIHELGLDENKAGIEKIVKSQEFKLLIYGSLINKLKASKEKDAVSVLSECRALAELLTLKVENKSVTTNKI